MTADATFAAERGRLLQLAYRMLGSVQDAEDVVQESWLRWQMADPATVQQPGAWLTRTCTNLCIDRLRAVERRGEQYPGEWLPEPFVDDAGQRRERDETLSIALLATLQKLSPAERAVFLLHDVFGYEFTEIAAMLELEPPNCRQLAVRARERLAAPPRAGSSATDLARLGGAFFAALRDGDITQLRDLLHQGAVLRADGGGKASAVHYPVRGSDRLARFFDRLFIRTRLLETLIVEPRWWNGAPGLVLRHRDGRIDSAYQFECDGDRITAIFVQRNPDKLRGLAR